jgi:streptogramin lyase
LDPPPSVVTNFPIPTSSSFPTAIVTGANNILWFAESGPGKIGRFNEQTNVTDEHPINETGATPATLAIDRAGLVWFSDENPSYPSVWYMDPSTFTPHRYLTNVANSQPFFVMVDSRTNNVWYTDSGANYLGEIINSTRQIVKYNLPIANSVPYEIAEQNGTSFLWVTEGSGRIARFDMAAQSGTNPFQEYTPSVPLTYPVGIVVDKNGSVWVSEHGGSSLTEFIPSNSTWRKYPTSQSSTSPGTGPATLTMDGLGRLWFAEHYSNRIGRLDPATGVMNEWQLPIPGAYSIVNTIDARGNFWFTESGANEIGTVPGNATFPIIIKPSTTPSSSVTSGTSTSAEFTITNNFATPVQLSLDTTSFFTTGYITTRSEVSLSTYSLSLNPGQSTNVTATITPDFSLSSGIYTAGIVATYNNTSTVRTLFLTVNTSPWYQLETLLPEILITAGIILAITFLVFRKRKTRTAASMGKSAPKLSLGATILIVLLSLVQQTRETWAKCPGLPPPPVSPTGNSPDYYGIALDIGSITFFAIVAYLLIKSRQ